MKTLPVVLLSLAVAVPVTWFAARQIYFHHHEGVSTPPAANAKPRKLLYYQSAMHPWIKSDKPGRCTLCGMELTPVYEGDAGFDATGGGDVVPLTQSMIQVMNVETAEVQVRPLKKKLAVAGVLDENATRHRVLSAYIPGRVQKLHVNFIGAEVTEGQPLAEFYSATLLAAEREYRTLSGDLRSATALRLLQMGLTATQIAELPKKSGDALTSHLLAPIGGTVVAQNVYEGQYVQEGQRLFEIADFSTMWFHFRAYEQDLPWIRLGLKVDVITPSHPGKTFSGSITFIDPNFDEATRSTKVRVELENPLVDGRRVLLHRLYADGSVHLEANDVLSVPRTAVIHAGPEPVAYADKGGGAYSRRVLKLGRRGDSHIEILSGLTAGEKVVVNGNLLIDGQAEMNRAFADPAALPPTGSTNKASEPAALPALSDAQRQATREFIVLVDGVTAALAADDLNKFNSQAALIHATLSKLSASFPDATNAWRPYLQALVETAQLNSATDLKSARKAFHPFSTAAVALARSLRRSDQEFRSLKIFRCPMTKDAFPGAPNRAEWMQLLPAVRNPYFGAEMLDCGSEVKP